MSAAIVGAIRRRYRGARPLRASLRLVKGGMIGERIFSGHPNEEKVGYARAVVVDGWVFVSGTTGFDAETKQYPADVVAQCENCFRNIERALKQAGRASPTSSACMIFMANEERLREDRADHPQALLRGAAGQHHGVRRWCRRRCWSRSRRRRRSRSRSKDVATAPFIPAQAGIQKAALGACGHWVPAFAGTNGSRQPSR